MKASKMSLHNADKITIDTDCSCYYCLSNFKGCDITEYVDEGRTAICPFCSIDSVLPEKISKERLEELYKENFTKRRSEYYKGD